MALYVADTHALAWYLTGSARISTPARQIFDDTIAGTHEVIIPVIVLAELIMISEKRRIVLNLTTIFNRLSAIPNFHFTSLSPAIVLRTQALTSLPDIHDRLIVATAIEASATLITRDQTITQAQLIPTAW